MTSSTLHRPGTDHGTLLPVFAIRAELETISDRATMREFALEVEAAIQVAAGKGSVEPVNEVLRAWLRIALTGQDMANYASLDRAERGRRGEELVDRWIQANAPHAA